MIKTIAFECEECRSLHSDAESIYKCSQCGEEICIICQEENPAEDYKLCYDCSLIMTLENNTTNK